MKKSKLDIIFITVVILTLMTMGFVFYNSSEPDLLVKYGSVRRIEYDVVFGGSFTDWRDELYFKDGTVLWCQDSDLTGIVRNVNATFYFEKDYFTYDNYDYKFHRLVNIVYDNNEYNYDSDEI